MDLEWSLMDVIEDVDEMWSMLKNALIYEADQMCPFIWLKVNVAKPVWFNSSLVELARDRDRLFRNFRRGGGKNQEIYKKASEKRKEFNKLVKNAKDDFFKEQLEAHLGNRSKNCRTHIQRNNHGEVAIRVDVLPKRIPEHENETAESTESCPPCLRIGKYV